MTNFGWTRLAYLLMVLSVLAALVQLGSPPAEPRALASEPGEEGAAGGDPPATAPGPPAPGVAVPATSTAPPQRDEQAAFARHLRRAIAGPSSTASGIGAATFFRPPPSGPLAPNPVSPAPKPAGPPVPAPICGDLARYPAGHRLIFPLPMRHVNSYGDTWGAPRPQGGHEGTDLMVPAGTPEYAVTDGTIVPVAGSNGNGWNSLGGYAVMLRAAHSVGPVREGDLFYYAHLNRGSTMPLGTAVRAGQVVGYAGDTGQGPEVTRGLFPPHLHLGWYDMTGARSYLPSGAMNPFPLLEWLKAGDGVLGGGSTARYCEVARPGAPTPSTGQARWPAAKEPGARPDLDTGSKGPLPSPAAAEHPQHPRQPGQAEKPSGAARQSQAKDARIPSDTQARPEPRSPGPPITERRAQARPEPRGEAPQDASPPGAAPPDDAAQPAPESGPKPAPRDTAPASEKDPTQRGDDQPENRPDGEDENTGSEPKGDNGDHKPGEHRPGEETELEEEETTPEPGQAETPESTDPEPDSLPETTASASASATAEATTTE